VVRGGLDGRAADGPVELPAGPHRLSAGTTVELRAGDTVPVVATLPATSNTSWSAPLGSGVPHPLYASLSLIVGICLGTMGLPHVLVRFYTNSDGRDSRRTTLIVIALLSSFYLLPTVFGTLGRRFAPDLLLTGNTDATALLLPERMLGGAPGVWLSALVTAGAFAAFLSTVSGLTVSVAGVLGQDLLRVTRASRRLRIRSFRLGAVLALAVPYVLSLPSERLGLAAVVALAFTVAASTFCPLLVLGIWWRRLTDAGALAGMVAGGGLSLFAVLLTLVNDDPAGWLGVLLRQPAVWTVPIAFAVMISVSLASPRRVPASVARFMIRLHAPEPVAADRR
jgi:Na+(H+)/acetate symporter ActP